MKKIITIITIFLILLIVFIIYIVKTTKIIVPKYDYTLSDEKVNSIISDFNIYSGEILNLNKTFKELKIDRVFNGGTGVVDFYTDNKRINYVNDDIVYKVIGLGLITYNYFGSGESIFKFNKFGILYKEDSGTSYIDGKIIYGFWKIRKIINNNWLIVERCTRNTCSESLNK